MKSRAVAVRMAWSFAGVFVVGLLVIAGAAFAELRVEAAEGEPLVQGVLEIAGEAAVCVALLSAGGGGWRGGPCGPWRRGRRRRAGCTRAIYVA